MNALEKTVLGFSIKTMGKVCIIDSLNNNQKLWLQHILFIKKKNTYENKYNFLFIKLLI